MKHITRFVACIAAFLTICSCSMLSGLAGGNATTVGSNTGSALLRLFQAYQVLKGNATTSTNYNYTGANSSTGLDLSNVANLINLGQVLTGASTLTNASQSYTNQFSNGLISGSSNLVNNNNVGGVLSGLLNLASGNTSVLSAAAASAAAGNQTNVTNQTAGASEALSTLGTIFSLLQ